jgi:hypothetical protein
MGKTSVWLSDELTERWKASGLTLSELIRRGLDVGEPESLEQILNRVLDERGCGTAHAERAPGVAEPETQRERTREPRAARSTRHASP